MSTPHTGLPDCKACEGDITENGTKATQALDCLIQQAHPERSHPPSLTDVPIFQTKFLPFPERDQDGKPTGSMIHSVMVDGKLLVSEEAFRKLKELNL